MKMYEKWGWKKLGVEIRALIRGKERGLALVRLGRRREKESQESKG